jgi:hypothetical protein
MWQCAKDKKYNKRTFGTGCDELCSDFQQLFLISHAQKRDQLRRGRLGRGIGGGRDAHVSL